MYRFVYMYIILQIAMLVLNIKMIFMFKNRKYNGENKLYKNLKVTLIHRVIYKNWRAHW